MAVLRVARGHQASTKRVGGPGADGAERPRGASRRRHGGVVALVTVCLLGVLGSAAVAAGGAGTSKLAKAVVIAGESRYQVVTLHDLAVSMASPLTNPLKLIHGSALSLEATLEKEQRSALALDSPPSSATALLAKSLHVYAGLAAQLAAVHSTKPTTMPAAFFKALAANDSKWRSALQRLDTAAHVNLLKEVPPLLFPKKG